jgi:hypothetical protein
MVRCLGCSTTICVLVPRRLSQTFLKSISGPPDSAGGRPGPLVLGLLAIDSCLSTWCCAGLLPTAALAPDAGTQAEVVRALFESRWHSFRPTQLRGLRCVTAPTAVWCALHRSSSANPLTVSSRCAEAEQTVAQGTRSHCACSAPTAPSAAAFM